MRVLVAMSGGVDSAAAALLCREAGYEPVGVTLLLTEKSADPDAPGTLSARAAAKKLSMEFYTEDMREDFKKLVCRGFVSDYMKGLTPNPCVECNRSIKFGRLFAVAEKYGCGMIVTGHYARTARDPEGRCRLYKGFDAGKDQSYMLHCIDREKLGRVMFPLGDMTKAQVRELAEKHGLSCAGAKDSQDICFVPDGDYAGYIERMTGTAVGPGEFVLPDGSVIGRHRGHIRYTPGQRKGLGLSLPSPLYVAGKDAASNRVLLCTEKELETLSVETENFNLISPCPPEPGERVTVKIRYGRKETPAVMTEGEKGRVRFDFESPVRAPAAGQYAVAYRGDEVIGGGRIVAPRFFP